MKTCWHGCAILACLCASLSAQPAGVPIGHTVDSFYRLTVLNGTGEGDYKAGKKVTITATPAPPGYAFLGWVILTKNGSISDWSESSGFFMPPHEATVAAIYGKVETWFPPGDEQVKVGLLLPKVNGMSPRRVEQKIRVTFSLGDGAQQVKRSHLWRISRVLVDWFPKQEAQGTWGTGEIIRCFDRQYMGAEIGRGRAIPKQSFIEVGSWVFEASVWHEGLWTSEQAAGKVGEDEEVVLPSVDIGVDLGVSTHSAYFVGRMKAPGELLPVEMVVDANRDGEVKLGSPTDKTTQGRPYAFWCNDDDDRNNEDHPESAHKDSDNNAIESVRDLEDFARLWLHVGAFHEQIAAGAVKFGLKWKSTGTPKPVIKVYEAVEGDGGTKYLTDPEGAPAQLNGSFGAAKATVSGENNKATLLPNSLFTQLSAGDPVAYLLFEGVSEGKGQLVITLHKADGTEIGDGPGVWLDIRILRKCMRGSQRRRTRRLRPMSPTVQPLTILNFTLPRRATLLPPMKNPRRWFLSMAGA